MATRKKAYEIPISPSRDFMEVVDAIRYHLNTKLPGVLNIDSGAYEIYNTSRTYTKHRIAPYKKDKETGLVRSVRFTTKASPELITEIQEALAGKK